MNLDFFAVISNLANLFVLVAVGFLAARTGFFNHNSSALFSRLLLKITLPCTIFISLVSRDYDPKFVHDSFIMIFLGLVFFVSYLYLSKFIARLLNVPENSRGVFAFASTFSNSGFMGFPIALALLGGEGLALSVMLNVAMNLILYSLGVMEMSEKNEGKISVKSILFSNINAAIVLSFIFYFGRIKLPEFVAAPVTYLSNITTPISMLIIGIALSETKGLEILTDVYVWECSAMKLVIVPLSLCAIFKLIPISQNPLIAASFVLANAMPAASTTVVLTETLNNENVGFAAKIMFVQNLLCVITIPLVCMMI